MTSAQSSPEKQLLDTLQRLLEVRAADLQGALSHATHHIAIALAADKVDAFVLDPLRSSMVAIGTSDQPLSRLQRQMGLDVLPIANGGRVIEAFQTGQTYLAGDVERDPDELKGIREALGVRSQVGVAFEVGGVRRGVLMIASQKPNFYGPDDARFTESVARWVGIIAHRAELIEAIARSAVERGRRAVAEELVTVLAHDLRNYISPIDQRLQLLRRRADREARGPDVRDAQLAIRGLQRLSGMISDILDVARLDQGVLLVDLGTLELCGIVEDVAMPLSTPDHRIELEKPSTDVLVRADPARLRQCLENVLSNAVKHSPEHAPIFVRIAVRSRDGRAVAQVEIEDQGPGIPPELRSTLFERFVKGGTGEGLGLGLYLAKRIALLHGGDLEVEPGPTRGTTFTLTLPASADE